MFQVERPTSGQQIQGRCGKIHCNSLLKQQYTLTADSPDPHHCHRTGLSQHEVECLKHQSHISLFRGTSDTPDGEAGLLPLIVTGCICKHVLESVSFSQQQAHLLVPPVDGGKVLQKHEKALKTTDTRTFKYI